MIRSTGNASLFLSHAAKSNFTFRCALDCRLGAYSLQKGEPMKALYDGCGMFFVYVEWANEAVARLNAHDVNKLAGYNAVGK